MNLRTDWFIEFSAPIYVLIGITALLGLVASSLSLLIGSIAENVSTAIQMTPLLLVPQLLFSGFFVAISDIPEWLRWAQYLCSLKYAINLILVVEFTDVPRTWNTSISDERYYDMVYGCHNGWTMNTDTMQMESVQIVSHVD